MWGSVVTSSRETASTDDVDGRVADEDEVAPAAAAEPEVPTVDDADIESANSAAPAKTPESGGSPSAESAQDAPRGEPVTGPVAQVPGPFPGPAAPPAGHGPAPFSPRPGTGSAPAQAPVQPSVRPRPRPDAGSAAELTEDAIVRFRSDRPQSGWRGMMYKASGGLVNPGIGPAEKARQEQLRRIRRPLPGSHQIAVSSLKGGVGKTSVAACLGLVLAENRGDRVIALDANPDAGTLADRLTAETSVTVRTLIDNIEATHSLTDIARYTSLTGRLQVLASEQDPAMSEAFNRDEYERVCEVLTRFYNIVITDSGTGLVHSAMEGTLALADSLVVVGSPTVDGASRASKTLDWLIAHGHAAQVANAVIVLSCDRTSKEVDRTRVRSHFQARCRAVVEVPHDPHLATGGRIRLDRLRRPTLDAFLALAALLADGFGGPVRSAGTASDQVPSPR
jgi:MinD-like ATPase involved in chromosome partitioning or flagellar assembly